MCLEGLRTGLDGQPPTVLSKRLSAGPFRRGCSSGIIRPRFRRPLGSSPAPRVSGPRRGWRPGEGDPFAAKWDPRGLFARWRGGRRHEIPRKRGRPCHSRCRLGCHDGRKGTPSWRRWCMVSRYPRADEQGHRRHSSQDADQPRSRPSGLPSCPGPGRLLGGAHSQKGCSGGIRERERNSLVGQTRSNRIREFLIHFPIEPLSNGRGKKLTNWVRRSPKMRFAPESPDGTFVTGSPGFALLSLGGCVFVTRHRPTARRSIVCGGLLP
jgi:hypothetical protein